MPHGTKGGLQPTRHALFRVSHPHAPNTAQILNVLAKMKNTGKSDYSTRFVDKSLTYISKHANLNQPEEVKQFIANLQTSNGYKRNLALKDESGQELDCLVIAIAQTKKVIQVKDEQGKFSCPTRQATGLHRGTYEEILQSKTSVLYDNYNFISNLSAFLDGR